MVRLAALPPTRLLPVLFAAIALLLAACGGGDSAVPQSLTLNIRANPPTLDPALANSAESISVVRQLFRGLLRFDEQLNLVPDVAESVPSLADGTISDDGLHYVFHLRQDARWSDDRPVTAGDFEYAIKRLLDPAFASGNAPFFYAIAGAAEFNTAMTQDSPPDPVALDALRDAVAVRALDNTTLEVDLVAPRYTFLDVMAMPAAFPIRADVVAAHGDSWAQPGALIGNGPFTLAQWAHDDRIVLAAVADWWGGSIALDSLVFRMIPDDTAAYAAFQSGELDVIELPPPLVASVQADPALAGQLVRVADLSTLAYVFNVRHAPFDDLRVRRAFSLAIDRDALVNAVQGGVGVAAVGWLPPTLPGAGRSDTDAPSFDPAAAQALLADAGYPAGDGFPSVRLVYANVGPNQVRAEFAQAQILQNLGLHVDLLPLDPSAMGPALGTGDFDLALFGWTADYPDPDNWLPDIFSTGSPINFSGYSSAPFDSLVAQAMQELDPQRRLDLWGQAHALVVEDAPFAFLVHRERVHLVRPGIENLIITPIDGGAAGDNFYVHTFREAEASFVASP